MKKLQKSIITLSVVCAASFSGLFGINAVHAEGEANPESDFHYTQSADGVTITEYVGNSSTVKIPDKINGKTVTTIGEKAFYYNANVTSVDMSDTHIVTLDDEAFELCSNISTVQFPDTLETIGNYVFFRDTSISSINLSSTNVTSMGNDAFFNCTSMTSIDLPSTLETIGELCFASDETLTSIDLSNTQIKLLSHDAFDSCYALSEIKLPETLEVVDKQAIVSCKSLISVDFSNTKVKSFNEQAIIMNDSLEEIILPDCVQNIAPSAFEYNKSLASMDLSKTGINIINHDVFFDCQGLKTVKLPAAINVIDKQAFSNCKALESINLQDTCIVSIGSYAFDGCEKLTEIILPSTTKAIGDYCFKSNDALQFACVPPSVESIGTDAFRASYMDKVKFYGEKGSKIEEYCKDNNRNFVEHYFSVEDKDAEGALVSAGTCKTKAVYAKSCMFCGKISENKDDYFEGELDPANHAGETEVKDKKDATEKEDGYTGDTYCSDCGVKIKDGTVIPKTGKDDKKDQEKTTEKKEQTTTAEQKTTTEQKTTEQNTTADSKKDDSKGKNNGDGKVQKGETSVTPNGTFTAINSKEASFKPSASALKKSTITIPSTVKIDGKTVKVTSIANNAFKNNKKLTKVVIGENIKTIGSKAFYGCKNLKSVKIKSTKLTKIGSNAFKGINKKASFKVPKKQLKKYTKMIIKAGASKNAKITK